MGVASTVFFLMECAAVNLAWKTSLHVGALVTLVAAVHYFYMREYWVILHSSPILYRYIDWSITVPLQMIEFNLILKAVKPDISAGMFWRLMIGTVVIWHSATEVSADFSGHTLVSSPAVLDGATSCRRSLLAKLVSAIPRTSMLQTPSTPCVSLSQRAGLSILSATSSATCGVQWMMLLST